jgi:hypothetical protein
VHPVRRIVTGHDAQGRAIVLEDALAKNTVATLTNLWATSTSRAPIDAPDVMTGPPHGLAPPKGGTVFRFFEIPPEGERSGSPEAYAATRAAFEAMGAGHNQVDTARHPAMHKTETVDYIILLKGEVTLLLDEDERGLQPLDVVIQRGTNHAWVNHGTEPAVLMAVLVDGTYGAESRPR